MKVTYEKDIEMYGGLPCCPGHRIICDIILSLTILRGVILVDKRWIDEACKCLPAGMDKKKHFCAPGFAENDWLVEKLENPDVSVNISKFEREIKATGKVWKRIMVTIKANAEDTHPVILQIDGEAQPPRFA